jgi:hypothetical protein
MHNSYMHACKKHRRRKEEGETDMGDLVWCSAVMVLCNALFLAYTAIIAPVQICLWNYNDPCNSIATLYFDAIVDIFFLVPSYTSNLVCHCFCMWI